MRLRVIVAFGRQFRSRCVSRLCRSIDRDIFCTIRINNSYAIVDQNVIVGPANHLIHSRRANGYSPLESHAGKQCIRLFNIAKERSASAARAQVDERRFFPLFRFIFRLTLFQLNQQCRVVRASPSCSSVTLFRSMG